MTGKELADMLTRNFTLNAGMGERPFYLENGGEVTGLGLGGKRSPCLTSDFRPTDSEDSKWEIFKAMFKLAKIPVLAHWRLANGYWPDSYMVLCAENPWWLVKTPVGLIEIGWRKRVLNIDWEDTPIRCVITQDDTTKSPTSVHAWTAEKAIEYLTTLGTMMGAPR